MHDLQVIPTYISVRLTPASRLRVAGFYTDLAQRGFAPMSVYDLHVTVLFSYHTVERRNLALAVNPARRFGATVTGAQTLGTYTVLMLESDDLTERHREWASLGLEHAHPEYLPHLSFGKGAMTPELGAALERFNGTALEFYQETVRIGHKN